MPGKYLGDQTAGRAGKVVDELIVNQRLLMIAHGCLALAAAFVYWVRPGTFSPRLPGRYGAAVGPTFSIITTTLLAWAPWLISSVFSGSILAARTTKATLAFIALASAICIIAACLYLNLLFHDEATLSPLVVSVGVTVALIAAISLCGAI